jgi:hypothetical protein
MGCGVDFKITEWFSKLQVQGLILFGLYPSGNGLA